MEIKIEKGSTEWQLFQDYWKMYQQFFEPEVSEAYLEEVAKKAREFYEKYKTDFAKDLAAALVNDVHRKVLAIQGGKTV